MPILFLYQILQDESGAYNIHFTPFKNSLTLEDCMCWGSYPYYTGLAYSSQVEDVNANWRPR